MSMKMSQADIINSLIFSCLKLKAKEIIIEMKKSAKEKIMIEVFVDF